MDFMVWSVRAMHLFAVVLWLGGILYQSVTLIPNLQSEAPAKPVLDQMVRFVPFLRMGLITVLVTGVLLMLFDPRFVFMEYSDWWSVALGLKQAAFVLMAVLTYGLTRISIRLREAGPEDERLRGLAPGKLALFNRQIVFLGIAALLLAASMH